MQPEQPMPRTQKEDAGIALTQARRFADEQMRRFILCSAEVRTAEDALADAEARRGNAAENLQVAVAHAMQVQASFDAVLEAAAKTEEAAGNAECPREACECETCVCHREHACDCRCWDDS